MNRNWRAVLAVLSILVILAYGGLMSFVLLKADRVQVSQEEWATLVTRLANLEQRQASPSASTTDHLAADKRIPINQADQSLLEELPGIGPARARAILEARSSGGPFQDLADLDARVPSIPTSVLNDIASKISFE